MPHMLGHWYDVNCSWCGSTLRVRGPRPCRDEDPPARQKLGPCPACAAHHPVRMSIDWQVPSFDLEVESPEHLQQLADQGQQHSLDFGTPAEQAAVLEQRRRINPWDFKDLEDTE